MEIFRGIWPALVTPSNADNTVNTESLCALIDYLIDKEVDGFYVGGTTGEGIFMPVSQRKLLAETALRHINGRVPVILHVGAISIDDAIDMAQHAKEQGAVGISSIIPPMYTSLNTIVPYYQQLAASVGNLPFIAYILNPTLDSVIFMQQLMNIPNLAGTKYTGPNMYEFRQILNLGAGKWTMFSGMDEQCVYAAMMGATGAIGSTINIMPGVYKKIHAYVQAGEITEAQSLQVRANRVTETMIRSGFSGALKALLSELVGQAMGEPRLPNLVFLEQQKETLKQALAETDFEELTAM